MRFSLPMLVGDINNKPSWLKFPLWGGSSNQNHMAFYSFHSSGCISTTLLRRQCKLQGTSSPFFYCSGLFVSGVGPRENWLAFYLAGEELQFYPDIIIRPSMYFARYQNQNSWLVGHGGYVPHSKTSTAVDVMFEQHVCVCVLWQSKMICDGNGKAV